MPAIYNCRRQRRNRIVKGKMYLGRRMRKLYMKICKCKKLKVC